MLHNSHGLKYDVTIFIQICQTNWNALPEDVVLAPIVKVFEYRLDKFWNNQPMKFNHKKEAMSLNQRSGQPRSLI